MVFFCKKMQSENFMEIQIIRDYILYPIEECGLSVTLHPLNDESLITGSSLIDFNIHDNSYCSYIKSLPNGHLHCLAQQKKVFSQCCKKMKALAEFATRASKNIAIRYTMGKIL